MFQRVCDHCVQVIPDKVGYLRSTIIGPGGEYEDEETKDFCSAACQITWTQAHDKEVADRIHPPTEPGLELRAAPATT